MVTFFSPLQFLNDMNLHSALPGIDTAVRRLQLSKASDSISVRPAGKVIDVSPQPWKAPCPIFVTDAGISTRARLLHSRKVAVGISVRF